MILTLGFDVGAWHLPELSGSHPECLQGTCIPAKRKLTTILNVYTPPWSNMPQGQPGALIFLFPPTSVHAVTPLLTCQCGNCCFLKPHHEAAPQGGSACSDSIELKTDVHFRAHPGQLQGLPAKGKHSPLVCWPCVVHSPVLSPATGAFWRWRWLNHALVHCSLSCALPNNNICRVGLAALIYDSH